MPNPLPYQTTTLATARAQLAARLTDPSQTFYTNVELGVYIVAALRTFQAYGAGWRDRVQATLPLDHQTGQQFYDLTDIATDLCGRSVLDQDLLTEMCYHLLEFPIAWPAPFIPNPPASTWNGTAMFTLDDLTQAIQRRRDQFLLESGVLVTHLTVPVPASPIGRVPLSTTVMDVRRAAWIGLDVNGAPLPAVNLWKEDVWAFNGFQPGWSVGPSQPLACSILTPPPVQVQLAPPPSDLGTLDLLALQSGPVLSPGTKASILGVPDDWAWVVLFGALSDLLGRDGPARDPDRATYCQQRWTDGIGLARIASTVLNVELNGVPLGVLPSLYDLDGYQGGWQGPTGTPVGVALAGLNLVAVYPIPDANGPYSLTLDVVRQMPVPYADTDYMQVGAEALDVVLDYAQHLAAFKMGGAEFQATMPHYQRFIAYCQMTNERIRNESLYVGSLGNQTKAEGRARPERDPATASGVELVGSEG